MDPRQERPMTHAPPDASRAGKPLMLRRPMTAWLVFALAAAMLAYRQVAPPTTICIAPAFPA